MTDSTQLLHSIPKGLRDPLIQTYRDIVSNYLEERWKAAELDGGWFSETVYTILEGTLDGSYAAKPSKPKNMVDACRGLEKRPADLSRPGDHSLRILIPRVLLPLYEIRNNRSVGHVGGDVDPNFMDATAVYNISSWVLAELIRIFHDVSISKAQEIVDSIVERKLPFVWEIAGIRRVIDMSIKTAKDQALVLLYTCPGWASEGDLFTSVEYSSASMFRKRVLIPLHKERKIEFDAAKSRAHISPLGAKDVEERILKGALAAL